MKLGFSLVEVLIGLFLASIIGTVLYNSFFVSSRTVNIGTNVMEFDTRISLLSNQLEKDLAGAFVPIAAQEQKKAQQAAAGEKKLAESLITTTGEPRKPLEKVFFSTHVQDSLSVLSFITNNPVRVYDQASDAQPKPRIVRVVYRVVADVNNTYKIMRQESTELDYKRFDLKEPQAIRAYELVTGVKQIAVEYLYNLKEEQSKDAKAQKSTEKKLPELLKSKEWPLSVIDQRNPQLPRFVTISVTFWDNEHSIDRSYTITCEIAAFLDSIQPPRQATSDKISSLQSGAAESQNIEKSPSRKSPSLNLNTKLVAGEIDVGGGNSIPMSLPLEMWQDLIKQGIKCKLA